MTGATGFLGSVLCDVLSTNGYTVRAALRHDRPTPVCERAVVGDFGPTTEWANALEGVECVIHAAARAHVLNDSPLNASLYDQTNAQGTRRLAEAAAQAGVRRMVYVSSIKVNGEQTFDRAFHEADAAHPQDAYGRSKWLGEQHLLEVAAGSNLQAVIVRPPLVYGPGVRANFLRLLQWVDRERPLPLGAVQNKRSLVSIWNLCSLLVHVLEHPAAVGRVWMVSDGEDLSTPDLIRQIGRAMNRRVRLPPIPLGLLQVFAALLGKRSEVTRLCGSLVVDATPTREELAWSPPLNVSEGLARTVSWYMRERRFHET